jgi:hypothetical protein
VTTAAEVRPAASPTWLDRALAAYPLVLAYVGVLILVAWQTTKHVAPWNFVDELKWAELSRSVADTGHAQLRLHDAPAGSLYTYFVAPAWWFGDTDVAYAAAKYLNAAVMTATLFPAYGLARLFAGRWLALAAAVASAVVPGVVYASMLIPEPLAYFWSTLTLWLVARALLRPRRWSIALAVVSVLVAPLVRSQLGVLAVAATIAVAVVVATSARGRATVRTWGTWDWIGAVVLAVGGAIIVNAWLTHHSYSWQVGTHFAHRMFTYGLWAAGAFVIGIGVVPVIVALAWGLSARISSLEDRVLLGLLLGTVLTFGLYTAVKASYISTVFAIRVEDRNLIYLSPLVFVVTARWLEQGRARLVAIVAAAAGVWYVVDTTPYYMEEHFSVDSPGLAILSWLNRTWYWTPTDAKRLFAIVVVVAAALLAGRELLARRRVSLGRWRVAAAVALAITFALVGAWTVTGEITAANASNSFSRAMLGPLPKPPEFVDEVTHGERTMFLGSNIGNSNAFWSLEFWNGSLADVWSIDASAPPPGPSTTPNFAAVDGTVDPQIPVRWALTDPTVGIAGRTVLRKGGLRVVRVARPLRISHEVNGVTPDGWMSAHSWFAQFSGRPGVAVVSLSRSGACGDVPTAHMTVRVGDVRIDRNAQPALGRVRERHRVVVRSSPCETKALEFHVKPPFRIDVTATPRSMFQPSRFDQRNLSVQISYAFKRGR